MDPARLEKELGRARSPVKAVKGYLIYEPAGKELYRITRDGEAVVIQTLDGRKVARIESDHDFWEAVNTFANLGYRLKEFGNAVKTPLNDISLDVRGSEITASAAGISYIYGFQARPKKPWKIVDSLRTGDMERNLNMGSIKAAIKKIDIPQPTPKPPKPEKTMSAETATEPAQPAQPTPTTEYVEPPPPSPAYTEPEKKPEPVEEEERKGDLLVEAVFDVGSVRDAFTSVMRYDELRFNLRIDETGITVYKLDVSHVTMLMIKLKAERAMNYRFYGSTDDNRMLFTNQTELLRLESLLQDQRSDKHAIIRVYTINERRYRLEVQVEGVGKRDLMSEDFPDFIPRIQWVASLQIELKTLNKQLRGTDLIFLAALSENTRYILTGQIDNDSNISLTYLEIIESEIQKPSGGPYNTTLLAKIIKLFRQFTDKATIKFSDPKERFTAVLGMFWENGIEISYLQAPHNIEKFENFAMKLATSKERIDERTPLTRYMAVLEPEAEPDIVAKITYPSKLAQFFHAASITRTYSVYIDISDKVMNLLSINRVTIQEEFKGYALDRGEKTLIEIPYIAVKMIYRFLANRGWNVTLSIYLDRRKAYFTSRGDGPETEMVIVNIRHGSGPYEWQVNKFDENKANVILHVRVKTSELKKALEAMRRASTVDLTAQGRTLSITNFRKGTSEVLATVIKEGSFSHIGGSDLQEMAEAAHALGDEAELRTYVEHYEGYKKYGAIMEVFDEDGIYKASIIL